MKEIVFISGKGGSGKTSVMTSFAVLAGKKAVAADCDVDAADVHLILNPEDKSSEEFYSGIYAEIDSEECIYCGACAIACRFGAVKVDKTGFSVRKIDCEGCGYCAKVCPTRAVRELPQKAGDVFYAESKLGAPLVHARLGIGAENSGKLVTKVRKEAKKIAEQDNYELILVDGSPGIGCPVVASLTGADYAVLVTEPTVSGLHDLKRVRDLIKRFGISAACIVNKADINLDKTNEIKRYLKEEGIRELPDLPYDEAFTAAMKERKAVVEFSDGEISQKIKEAYGIIKNEIDNIKEEIQ